MTSEKLPLLGNENFIVSSSDSDDSQYKKNIKLNGKNDFQSSELNVVSTYDDVLPYLGDIGVWQIVTVILLGVLAADGGILVLLQNFTGLEPEEFRCAISSCDGPNASYSDFHFGLTSDCNTDDYAYTTEQNYNDLLCWQDLNDIRTYRFSEDTLLSWKDMCLMPAEVSFNTNVTQSVSTCSSLDSSMLSGVEQCDITNPEQEILFAPFEYTSTIVTEFKLVCDEQYKIALSGTFYMIGLLIGSFVGGPPADHFGRKPVLFFFLICAGLTNLAGGLVGSYWPYAISRGIAGMCEQGLTQVSITLSMELVGVKYQGYVGGFNQGSFAIGTCVVGLVAFLIREWRLLHFVTSLLIIPQFFVYWFVIPESPRWLISKQKWKSFRKVLDKGLKMNRCRLPQNVLIPDEDEKLLLLIPSNDEDIESEASKSRHVSSYSDRYDRKATSEAKENISWSVIFTSKTLVSRTCIMLLDWGIVALVYYGAGMSSTLLGGNIFVNFFLVAAVEVAANIVIVFFINNWGRKASLVFGFLVSGIGCSTLGFLSDLNSTSALVMLLLGKFGASFAFTAIYITTNELFPTPIRNTAVGTCSLFSRLFSMTAPYISQYLPAVTYNQAPFLVFGVCGLVGCVCSVFLPESLGHPLPDTMQDAADMNKYSKSIFTWWSKEKLEKKIEERLKERHKRNN